MNVAETIKSLTRQHLENGYQLYGQCVSAVGWVGGTVPDVEGIVELPTSDCSNSAIVCGAALAGKKPIYVIRYQGFLHYNGASLFNYAAKSLEMWGQECPIFIRAIGMEGSIGPVASGMCHSMALRMPGMYVCAPITPREWQDCFNTFRIGHKPVFCSEHRLSYKVDYEISNKIRYTNPKVTLFVIGPSRLDINENFIRGLHINIIHIHSLKPLSTYLNMREVACTKRSEYGIVVDDDSTFATGAIANQLSHMFEIPVHPLGLDDRTAGFGPKVDNKAPTVDKILRFINGH